MPASGNPTRPDGSFAGYLGWGGSAATLKFTSTGQVLWTVAEIRPKTLRENDTLLGQGQFGFVALDAAGVAMGAVDLPVAQSWNRFQYRIGSIEQLNSGPEDIDNSFWPVDGGNQSKTGANIVRKLRFVPNDSPDRLAVIATMLSQLQNKLQADSASIGTCSGWLTNPVSPSESWSTYLPVILDNRFRHGAFKWETYSGGKVKTTDADDIAASVNGQNPGETVGIFESGVLVGVNDNDSFFNPTNLRGVPWSTEGIGEYGGNNPRAQSEILLHELAHLIVGEDRFRNLPADVLFKKDFAKDVDDAAEEFNRKRLDAKCGYVIRSFPR